MSGLDLPRLAVVSDVIPERTTAGQLLLDRLLAGWPADRLRVVDGNLYPPRTPGRELPGVQYGTVRYTVPRLQQTRLRPQMNGLHALTAAALASAVGRRLTGFRPQAVLSITQGHLWRTAAVFAQRRAVPLHLICHDDLGSTTPLAGWAAGAAERRFAAVFRRAASRLCVSPGMADTYGRRYAAACTVLYPSRGDDSPHSRVRAKRRAGGLTVGYAGALWMPGCPDQLADLAAALQPVGGRLVLFTRDPLGRLAGLPNVTHGGFVPAAELADRLGEVADVLFAPMSFHASERATVTLAFPSKLADYTAIGLPLLIQGPADCSAVRWAAEFRDTADVVTEPGPAGLAAAVGRLAADPDRRVTMAERAVAAGEQCFALAAARRTLYAAVGTGTGR